MIVRIETRQLKVGASSKQCKKSALKTRNFVMRIVRYVCHLAFALHQDRNVCGLYPNSARRPCASLRCMRDHVNTSY